MYICVTFDFISTFMMLYSLLINFRSNYSAFHGKQLEAGTRLPFSSLSTRNFDSTQVYITSIAGDCPDINFDGRCIAENSSF